MSCKAPAIYIFWQISSSNPMEPWYFSAPSATPIEEVTCKGWFIVHNMGKKIRNSFNLCKIKFQLYLVISSTTSYPGFHYQSYEFHLKSIKKLPTSEGIKQFILTLLQILLFFSLIRTGFHRSAKYIYRITHGLTLCKKRYSFHLFSKKVQFHSAALSWGYSMILDTSLWKRYIFQNFFSYGINVFSQGFVTLLRKGHFEVFLNILCHCIVCRAVMHTLLDPAGFDPVYPFLGSTNRYICHTFRMIACYFNQPCPTQSNAYEQAANNPVHIKFPILILSPPLFCFLRNLEYAYHDRFLNLVDQ